jgi:ketosteroid isomerase-like protein
MTNLDTIKDMYADYGRGDLTAILAKLAPDVSWESELPAMFAFGGIRKGIDEVPGFFKGLVDEYTDPVLDITDYVAEGDSVATFGRYQATDKATGVRIDTPIAHLFKFRDGKVVRYVNLINSAAYVEARQAK